VVLNVIALLLAVVLVGLVFQLFNTYSVHALKVRTEVKATPPGIAKIIDKKGRPPKGLINPKSNRPSILTINTDIDFGTVFPEETVQGHFIVYLTGTGNTTDNETWKTGPFTAVTYNVTMSTNVTPYKDLRPHLVVQRDPAEADIEPDNTANGTSNDYSAQGSLNVTDNDTGDKWFVTLEVPDDTGDYWIEIMIEVP
jgi:hypothetical protein